MTKTKNYKKVTDTYRLEVWSNDLHRVVSAKGNQSWQVWVEKDIGRIGSDDAHISNSSLGGLLSKDKAREVALAYMKKDNSYRLNTEENKVWQKSFEYYSNQGYSDAKSDKLAYQDLVAKYPHIKNYKKIVQIFQKKYDSQGVVKNNPMKKITVREKSEKKAFIKKFMY